MNGISKPDTERLTLLAKSLAVSSDYLLGLTDVQSIDTNMQAVCAFTGLSEDAVSNIANRKQATYSPFYAESVYVDDAENIRAAADDFLSDSMFYKICATLSAIKDSADGAKFGFLISHSPTQTN
jgi:hypothetical protein